MFLRLQSRFANLRQSGCPGRGAASKVIAHVLERNPVENNPSNAHRAPQFRAAGLVPAVPNVQTTIEQASKKRASPLRGRRENGSWIRGGRRARAGQSLPSDTAKDSRRPPSYRHAGVGISPGHRWLRLNSVRKASGRPKQAWTEGPRRISKRYRGDQTGRSVRSYSVMRI